MNLSEEGQGWASLLGACYLEDHLARAVGLAVEELQQATSRMRYLCVQDDTGRNLYPSFALTEEFRPLPGLQQVLTRLQGYSPEPSTWVWWLRTPHPDLPGNQTPEEALIEGTPIALIRRAINRDIAAAGEGTCL